MHRSIVLAFALASACKPAELFIGGAHHQLRTRDGNERASSPERPPIVILALDGVSRPLLYEMIRRGELPAFSALLGGDGLAHAYFDDSFVSTLPSTTMAAWTTAFTGVPPAYHGVTGNEYFIRETSTLACPSPVSFSATDPTIEIYTDGYLNKLIDAPTVYERVRERDPSVLIWVGMNHVFRGADKLVLTKRDVIVKALEEYFTIQTTGRESGDRSIYAKLDTSGIEAIVDGLASGPTPDILTVYTYGTDMYAHVAAEGPDAARRGYLRDVVDPALGKLVARLRQRGMLQRAWVVITADHGHTEVPEDHVHALGDKTGAPPAVLRAAGFRVRPFARDTNDKSFTAVLAYGGAMAYLYVADRSTCPAEHDACDWKRPPRYREDVLVAADAFYRANVDDPQMRDSLDLILVREPRPYREVDRPFEAYVGNGKTMPLDAYLAAHPHPTYVDFVERMRDLAVGPHGERAGDILLLAHDGDRPLLRDRFYFATPYHSWHGSPARSDSEIPLIVASCGHKTADIAATMKRVLGNRPRQQKVADLVVALRTGRI